MKKDKITPNNLLLALAAEMSAGTALEPAPDFAQRLRCRLLDKFPAQSRHTPITHRWAWMASALCILVVGMIAVLPFNKPTTTKVLARTIDALTIKPGQIVHQIYTSHGGLYQEWRRVDATPRDRITIVESITIRYAANDTDFTQPEEWFYVTSGKFCNLSRVKLGIRYPKRDEEGCIPLPFDSADQETDPLAPLSGEDLQQRLQRLKTNPGNVIIEKTTFDERNVYKLIYTRINPQPELRVFTDTLYIDVTTYLPAGYAYTLEMHSGRIYGWQTTVLDYEVLDPSDIPFDPFIWPPPDSTQP